MRIVTLAQVEALDRVYQRDLARVASNLEWNKTHADDIGNVEPTWSSFADCINAALGAGDPLILKWAGMWLAIEQDGHTHS